MMTLKAIEERLQEMGCPLCYRSELGLILQCTAADKDCIFVAECLHCSDRFQITEATRTLDQTADRVAMKAAGAPCPFCDHTGGFPRFQCEVNSKDCFFLIECPRCCRFYRMGSIDMMH